MKDARRAPSFERNARRAPNAPLFAIAAIASLGALAAALVSQYLYGMEPCPWCVLERLIFVAILLFSLLGLAWRDAAGTWLAGTVACLLALSGLAAALWQHFVAARSESCSLTLADRIVGAIQLDKLLPEVFEARASCADAAVSLFGVPYDFWAAALFVICALLMVRALRLAA